MSKFILSLAIAVLFPLVGQASEPVDYATPEGRAAIRTTIHQNIAKATLCFAKAQKQEPNLKGKLVMTFKISALGKVFDPAVVSSTVTPEAPGLTGCIAQFLESLEFPESIKNQEVFVVRFPFTFGE